MMKRIAAIQIRILFAFLMVFTLYTAGFAQENESAPAQKVEISQNVKDQLSALLPDAKALNLTLDGSVEFYGQNLYELIDGAAGIFHDYDFVTLCHAIYRQGDMDITVDNYFMGEPLNAFGVFSTESSPDYNFIEIGAAGYLEEGILNFVQGPYYVKLTSYGSDAEKVKTLLKTTAENISTKMKDGKTLPVILSLLPKKDLVARTQGYSKKAPLGLQFLSPAVTAEYKLGEQNTSLIVSLAKDETDAQSRLKQMREQVTKTGGLAELEGHGPDAFRGKDKYRGEIIGFAQAGLENKWYTVFAVKPPEKADEFLAEIVKSLNPEKK
jgi:hypothetical protein